MVLAKESGMLPEMKGGPMHGGCEWEEVRAKNSRTSWYITEGGLSMLLFYPLLISVHTFQSQCLDLCFLHKHGNC